MVKRLGPASRWNTIVAVLVAAILAVAVAITPATADHGKARGRKHKIVHRHHHYRDHHYRDGHSYRAARHAYPVWSPRPTRIHYYERRPYYLHSGFDVFFGGGGFSLQVGNIPPRGYVYYDPYCHLPFATVSAFHVHLHRHHHPALIDVVVADAGPYYHPAYAYSGYGYQHCGDWWDE